MSPVLAQLRRTLAFFARPVDILRTYPLQYLRPDLIAGLTVAVVTLPQAISFALISGLPPQVGLYAAIIGSIVGALWGSSSQLQTGPTNTTSLLILAVLVTIAVPGTREYVVAAGMMAVLVGVFRLMMGLARLGMLVSFVSDSVVVGFTAGAGALIVFNQIRNLLRLLIPSAPSLWTTLPNIVTHLPETHWPSLLMGLGTMALIVALRRINAHGQARVKIPGLLIGIVVAGIVVAALRLDGQGMHVVGLLPRGLPPFVALPLGNLGLIGKLATGSLAVGAIGLVEAASIARGFASQTGQRLDSNQEFVGQGLANIACGFFSGYTCSGSFTRSAVNYEAGAQTALSSVFGGLFTLIAMLVLAPLAAYVPLPALAGVLILAGYGLIDRHKIARIWRSGGSDRLIMVATMAATLALPLQYAVLSGIVVSLIYYLLRTSTPRVVTVLPDAAFRHLLHQPDRPACPQLGIVEVLGDLYFGAANHVEDSIYANLKQNPSQRYLLLRLQSVEHCDISGIHALEAIARAYRERHGDLYLARVRPSVWDLMRTSGFVQYLGQDHLLDQDEALSTLFYRVIDPAICIYECPVRAFKECQNLPKAMGAHPDWAQPTHVARRLDDVPTVAARALWNELHGLTPPLVIDVREPREFRRGHIPDARSLPLPSLLAQMDQVPRDRPVVLVCRGGRRSTRAAAALCQRGYDNVRALQGGMIAWEGENLLEGVG